ncbi:MAG: hypothetical protein HC771_13380 [Synechococcales cyanobacterium CRU_2_2]|nr:hypothetical protein [Synechococcales cyanobacterium CRU_2_2]
MTLYDYDLVILGETPAGQASAEYAARHRARVAWLVGPGDASAQEPRSTAANARAINSSASRAWRGFHALRECLWRQPLSDAFSQAQRLAQVSEGWENPAALMQLGVDVIAMPLELSGRFEPQGKRLGLQVPGRDRPCWHGTIYWLPWRNRVFLPSRGWSIGTL